MVWYFILNAAGVASLAFDSVWPALLSMIALCVASAIR
jgi:hypothetical protein